MGRRDEGIRGPIQIDIRAPFAYLLQLSLPMKRRRSSRKKNNISPVSSKISTPWSHGKRDKVIDFYVTFVIFVAG